MRAKRRARRKARCWGCGQMVRLTTRGKYYEHKQSGVGGRRQMVYVCAAGGGEP